MSPRKLQNLCAGKWVTSATTEYSNVYNPATGEVIAEHPLSTQSEIDQIIAGAVEAFGPWKRTPVPTRSAVMFRYRHLLTSHSDELAAIITMENGKTYEEAKGELLRAIQYVEHAAAVPETMKGSVTENIGTGVDIEFIREPLGVFAVIAPFNFPAMIPLYFAWAVATGNSVILKPSELCPLTAIRMSELAEEAGLPKGVLSIALGDKTVVERLGTHPDMVGLSFVGSSEIAGIVYKLVTGAGKRCQAQGGAKNHLVVTDTAAIDACMPNIVSSMYGNASQRCFAGSNVLVYEQVYDEFLEKLLKLSREFKIGNPTDSSTTLGPVISASARDKFISAINAAEKSGAKLLLDGRGVSVKGCEGGYWVGPTLIESDLSAPEFRNELFGPVRCIAKVSGLNEAIEIINSSNYGHTAVVYTESGGVAREFRQRVDVGQVGVNVGTPAPIAFYPVGGRKSSFYGDLRGRANDAVDFYTDKKIIVSTWHGDLVQSKPVDPAFTGKV